MKKIIIVVVITLLLTVTIFKINIFKDIKALFLSSYNNAILTISNIPKNFKTKQQLQNKINEYQSVIESYEKVLSENDILIKENKQIKELLDVTYENYTIKWANVIVRDNWYNKITIDKGKKNGIKEGMAVVNNKGLVGIIESVTEYSSEITLLKGKKIAVMVSSEEGFNYGVIEKYEDGYYKVTEIDGLFNIKEGDFVVSTNLNDKIPDNILIGTIENITYDNFGLSKILKVKPSVDFNSLSVVGVLLK